MKKFEYVFRRDGTLIQYEAPLKPGLAIRVSYCRTFMLWKRTKIDSALFVDRAAFERCLKIWNRLGGTTWSYSEEDPCPE